MFASREAVFRKIKFLNFFIFELSTWRLETTDTKGGKVKKEDKGAEKERTNFCCVTQPITHKHLNKVS